MNTALGLELPDYPWDSMIPYRRLAEESAQKIVDLSVGTPVDSTPQCIREALARAADAPGYPTAQGASALREDIVSWFRRRRDVDTLTADSVVPTVGSKEFIAWLPTLLGLGPGSIVMRPKIAYPTYDMGAVLAGATPRTADSLDELSSGERSKVRLVWVNSPNNPTGQVKSAAQLRRIVEQAREVGAVVASDECYAELGWGPWDTGHDGAAEGTAIKIPSVLDPRVSCGDNTRLLAVYSLSKQSNMAGYRAAFAAGDVKLIRNIVNSRKHAGMIVPSPIQAAMSAALNDDGHAARQKERYRNRRQKLLGALERAGYRVDGAEGGLYLWATDPNRSGSQDCWNLVEKFAKQGILVGPGSFYGQEAAYHIRIALTVSDEDAALAVQRLA